jgi:F0F1-type ATP synthase assembly protein I
VYSSKKKKTKLKITKKEDNIIKVILTIDFFLNNIKIIKSVQPLLIKYLLKISKNNLKPLYFGSALFCEALLKKSKNGS